MPFWPTLVMTVTLLTAAQTAPPAALTVSARLTVPAAGAAIGDELQLLEDPRVTPALQKELWDTGTASERLPDARNAELRLVRPDGTVADTISLERPLARWSAGDCTAALVATRSSSPSITAPAWARTTAR
jgi:hypothetical protein